MNKCLLFLVLVCLFSCRSNDTKVDYMEIDASKVHYQVTGDGDQNLLFVHGWGCDMQAWNYQEDYFKNKSKVILIDLPGFGKSSKDFAVYDIDFFAQTIIKLLDKLDVQKVHLIGHSLGHPVIKRIATLNPGLIESLTIVDGVYFNYPQDSINKLNYTTQLNQFVSMFSGSKRLENTRAFVNSLFVKSTPEEIRRYTDTTMMRVNEDVGADVMKNLIKADVWKLNEVEARTLAVYADIPELPENNDSILNVWYPELEYHEMLGVGHFLMMESPDRFNKILDQFIFDK